MGEEAEGRVGAFKKGAGREVVGTMWYLVWCQHVYIVQQARDPTLLDPGGN
jgi:hypothetical protein